MLLTQPHIVSTYFPVSTHNWDSSLHQVDFPSDEVARSEIRTDSALFLLTEDCFIRVLGLHSLTDLQPRPSLWDDICLSQGSAELAPTLAPRSYDTGGR